jgi:hypothetical protein
VSRRPDPLQGINLLEIAPVRLASWREDGDRVVVERPPPAGRGLRRLVDQVGFLLAARRLRLDAIGSFAWKHLDGSTTVGEVAAALRDAFGEAAEPAEERLGRFVRELRRDGFLAYPGWDAAAARADAARGPE